MRASFGGRLREESARGGWALLGAGAALVALLMLGSAIAAPVGASVTVAPAYKGGVVPEQDTYAYGCRASAAIAKPWTFHLKTGLGGGSEDGRSGHCAPASVGSLLSGSYSASYVYGSVEAGIRLPMLPASTGNITANLGGRFTMSGAASDGVRSGSCALPLTTESYNYTLWEWNYSTSASYFLDYGYVYDYQYDGAWYNSSYFSSPLPSPFNLNSTTYYYSASSDLAYKECYADAYASYYVDAYLYDASTGAYYGYNGSNAPIYGSMGAEVYNTTDYGSYSSSEWYGPYNYSLSYPLTTYSYNSSLTSEVWGYWYNASGTLFYSYSYGSNSTQPWSNTTSLKGDAFWFDEPFSSSDRYLLILEFYVSAGSSNTWGHGGASYSVNAASGGNGIKLTSITIS